MVQLSNFPVLQLGEKNFGFHNMYHIISLISQHFVTKTKKFVLGLFLVSLTYLEHAELVISCTYLSLKHSGMIIIHFKMISDKTSAQVIVGFFVFCLFLLHLSPNSIFWDLKDVIPELDTDTD